MRTSPRRPLILKRRKLTLPQNDESSTSARDENRGQDEKAPKQEQRQEDQHNRQPRDKRDCGLQKFPAGIKIIDHPTMPNTQVVAIPTNADIQSIIEALTAKGKECGKNGPNKFILISSGGTSRSAGPAPSQHVPSEKKASAAIKAADSQEREKNVAQAPGLAGTTTLWHSGVDPVARQEQETNSSGETMSSVLDNSLTNIQWLGKMRSDGLNPSSVKEDTEKENQMPLRERVKTEEEAAAASIPTAAVSSSWQDSVSERPPYSYMAMIQFAINSTEKKRMTLKDIYTWIEDHFPYFKHVAKPGWKNSIRHNLSLHDMFVRETSANGKISFWTIHPGANRCLTLDQVFKVSLSAEESPSLPTAAVKEEGQCDEGLFSPTHSVQENSSQPGEELSSFPEGTCKKEEEGSQLDPWLSPFASTITVKEEPSLFLPDSSTKERKQFTTLKSPSKAVSDSLVIKRRERREVGRSRRKQRLALPCSEEPVLVLPESSSFDPFQLGADHPFPQENHPLENISQLSCSQGEEGAFKTPVKDVFSKLPISSTPSKASATTTPSLEVLDQWKSASLAKGSHELDFSPVKTLQLPFTPLQDNQDLLGFNSTPLKNPLFDSPQELLNTESSDMVHMPLTSSPALVHDTSKQSSAELTTSGFTENRSLMEGLILDTMNDCMSLSKILLDISFPGLEDENLGTDISWSQLIPELK
ncbi:forkhead box protein M1 isoform X3 [Cyanistes caeruleus]|uniref:forkhead box protein M1 isoform X3 n=1 Tax=Cyanistes caeruleus TaxID=156563 RepID=UPI000CDACCA9|nr:forkhead box protein M1 isoform X3 [Cyanistes caeruleus]